MRGSVRKRGSTWTWYLDVDPNPLTGRPTADQGRLQDEEGVRGGPPAGDRRPA
jgi:hypothetical protein